MRILDYITVDDCGTVINPMIVEGQVQGGVSLGIGNALFEEVVYDDDGQLLTSTYIDYLLPTATDLPAIRVHHEDVPASQPARRQGGRGGWCGRGARRGPQRGGGRPRAARGATHPHPARARAGRRGDTEGGRGNGSEPARRRMKVAVVGTGVGGLAVAGHAGLVGHEVAVHDVREEAVGPVRERGGIEVRGKEEGVAPVVVATTDIGEAAEGADVVVVTTQGPEQGAAAAAMAPSLTPDQVVLVMPGCTFGAVEVRAVLEEHGAGGIGVAETDSFPYGCAVPEPAVSQITSVKKRFGVAVLPPERREEIVGLVQRVFDTAEAAPSVLHTGLSNMNAILHVAPMVVNAGRVEHGSPFDFYGEGITPSVARVVQATDDERVAVAGRSGSRCRRSESGWGPPTASRARTCSRSSRPSTEMCTDRSPHPRRYNSATSRKTCPAAPCRSPTLGGSSAWPRRSRPPASPSPMPSRARIRPKTDGR